MCGLPRWTASKDSIAEGAKDAANISYSAFSAVKPSDKSTLPADVLDLRQHLRGQAGGASAVH